MSESRGMSCFVSAVCPYKTPLLRNIYGHVGDEDTGRIHVAWGRDKTGKVEAPSEAFKLREHSSRSGEDKPAEVRWLNVLQSF
jgi:hypothetical protein